MWRQVVLPVIIVGLSWLTMSVATSCYVLWLDASYQRVFDENIASATAAGALQERLWQFHAELITEWDRTADWSARLAAFERELANQFEALNASVTTPEERTLAESLHQQIQRYRDALDTLMRPESRPADEDLAARQAELFTIAAAASRQSDRIRQINDELSQTATTRRIRVRNIVLAGRSAASILVSALGIAFGWWTANRLKKSVTQIQVTLHDPSASAAGDLGTVKVREGDELASIRKQVELVVDRLRRTGEELRSAQDEVLRSERLAAIGGLAAGVAHELRNPLTSVKLLLQHAASRGGDAVVAAPRVALILDEIDRMESTIQGLLDFSRPAQPQRKLHDVRVTIERAMHLVVGRAEKQNVETELSLGLEPLWVNGDPQQLHQVFVNLLINGIEAMPDGGTLTVSLVSEPETGEIAVEIVDSGEGIPVDLLPRLFEPFASAKERGTGLGLAVSRRILEEHHGAIAVRPGSPHGAIFRVTLPAAVPEAVPVGGI
jgi:two-component system, NtrC family, sensor histidine kinase HydH